MSFLHFFLRIWIFDLILMIRSLRLDIWYIEIMSCRGSGLFRGIFYFAQIISFTVKQLTNTSAVFYRKSLIY